MANKELIRMPTGKLLDGFGAGTATPGSGSAAALLALVSCKMIQTVSSLTAQKEAYAEATATLSGIVEGLAADVEPRLIHLFQEDSAQFARTIDARVARDNERDKAKRSRLGTHALKELRLSTELALEIAELSVELGEYACDAFDLGYKSARGDSVVAITSAHAAAGGCIAIVYLNLTSFKRSDWALATRERVDGLSSRWNRLGGSAETRVSLVRDLVIKKQR